MPSTTNATSPGLATRQHEVLIAQLTSCTRHKGRKQPQCSDRSPHRSRQSTLLAVAHQRPVLPPTTAGAHRVAITRRTARKNCSGSRQQSAALQLSLSLRAGHSPSTVATTMQRLLATQQWIQLRLAPTMGRHQRQASAACRAACKQQQQWRWTRQPSRATTTRG